MARCQSPRPGVVGALLLPQLERSAQDGGAPAIVGVCGLAANPYIPAYCASKAGLLGRIGQPDEVAQAVAFLMSPKAPFITGTYLVVDGGVVSRHA